MNFLEASKMEDGTKFTLEEYDTYGYLYFHEGKCYSDKGVPQHATLDLFNATFKFVDEDWNLRKHRRVDHELGRCYIDFDVKKCRDLILSDLEDNFNYYIQEKDKKFYRQLSETDKEKAENWRCQAIVKKRFGDLK